ncbi:MAG: hypothetical protein A2452_02875 [Candidatus Firestonebacteria bacterium RIFOXYC2_FULL_39_67]|nr:MAG: hypothetical protein A2536_02290 [Candidatus Firestonebacteria bacterium RIFOXYD2_FULL_39_29]OGF55400.1 MAG: hypothetical protein A2452_02875 [Candidatus Firestonebacteria bacterium RIFOXYC2_FULL_39_67]
MEKRRKLLGTAREARTANKASKEREEREGRSLSSAFSCEIRRCFMAEREAGKGKEEREGVA